MESRARRRPYISPIMLRILAVNVGALLILGFGLLYTGQYEREMIAGELTSLQREGRLLGAALAEGGVRQAEIEGNPVLAADLSLHMLRKLAENNPHRTVIFSKQGERMLDSHQLLGPGGVVEIAELDMPPGMMSIGARLRHYLYAVLDFLPTRLRLPSYKGEGATHAEDYPGVIKALQDGDIVTNAWRDEDGRILLTAALPIQNLKNVIGAVLLMQEGGRIDEAVRGVQLTVVKLFLYALLVTVFLSLYLSETIARPIQRLGAAADKVRQSLLFRDTIPDFTYRRDEIGTLSRALREMTQALSDRIDAISHFAADVAHEIKNPLASVKSAVETLPLVKEQAQRDKLLAIINQDVDRMNRLISDISRASRLDSEVTRAEKTVFSMSDMLRAVAKFAEDDHKMQGRIRLDLPKSDVRAHGNDTQIFQVMQNILNNALSFVSDEGFVDVSAREESGRVVVHIDNDGPSIPDNKLEAIFSRFYSERPKNEKFGMHSGLGLSISRHIVKAHQGTIFAENLRGANNRLRGVRFTVILPKAGMA